MVIIRRQAIHVVWQQTMSKCQNRMVAMNKKEGIRKKLDTTIQVRPS